MTGPDLAFTRWRRRPDRADRETIERLEALLRRAGRRPLRLDVGSRLARLQELRRARAGANAHPNDRKDL